MARGPTHMPPPFRILALEAAPLSVPLIEPFVIASARIDATRAALVHARIERGGRLFAGFGEAAALPPVTREDQPELVRIVREARLDHVFHPLEELDAVLDRLAAGSPVARAAIESAILDGLARSEGISVAAWLAGGAGPTRAAVAPSMRTDVTLPIADPDRMAANALAWRARGFDAFKVKVGRGWERDRDALRAVHEAVPEARFRLDANEGFKPSEALALLEDARARSLAIDCFEQPCARTDPEGMAEVVRHGGVPVIADESLRSDADLDAILRARSASAVNLKLVKLGGLRRALALGRRAKREGLGVMAGAMVETKLGLTAMAHVVAALGGVDWVDLDTALLLERDPFEGGLRGTGPEIAIDPAAPGLDLRLLELVSF